MRCTTTTQKERPMYQPSNFHEDATRHYLLKLERAKEQGFTPNMKPTRKPSKATMMDILINGNLSPKAEQNLRAKVGNAQPTDPIQAILFKLSPDKRKQVQALLAI